MNFAVQIRNLPPTNHFLEVWWRAAWYPQGLQGNWVAAPTTGWMFQGAAPKGFVHISVWGQEEDPDAEGSTRWVKIQETRTGELSPVEGSTIVIDLVPSRVGWLLPLGLGVGVAALALVLARRR